MSGLDLYVVLSVPMVTLDVSCSPSQRGDGTKEDHGFRKEGSVVGRNDDDR